LIKLILTDMDGTFLNKEGDYNRNFFKEVKKKLKEKGVHFACVTGKQCERVEELLEDEKDGVWILGDSATRIKKDGEVMFESLIENSLGERILAKLEEVGAHQTLIPCTNVGAYLKDTVSESEAQIVRNSYQTVIIVKDFKEIKEPFVKITVHDPKGNCYDTLKKMESFQKEAYLVASEDTWLDIAAHGVHKGTTVARLQEMLSVSREETMAFGDGYNDLELLDRAHFSFAMRNAVDKVKDRARYITGNHHEDAVMQTMLDFLAL